MARAWRRREPALLDGVAHALAAAGARARRVDRLVVVGGGMSAHHFVERLVDSGAARRFAVSLLSEETAAPYDRVHLAALLQGADAHSLSLRDDSWYAANGIALHRKQPVLEIDRGDRVVRTASGAEFPFDRLVLATGGGATRPPIPGIDLPDVFTYRSLEDVQRIARAAGPGRRAVIVGGGLLGLETARALQRRGCRVEVVEAAPRLLPRQLDLHGARVLEAKVRGLGVHLHVHARIAEVREVGGALEVALHGGSALAADLVVVAVGTRPRDELAADAGLACHPHGGVLVDDGLATSEPHIHAIGECARHRDQTYGFVAPCYAMAEALAGRLAGEPSTFEGAVASARLKVDGIDVVTVGESLADGRGFRELSWVDDAQYRRIVIREGRMIGAITVGPSPDVPRLQEAIARGAPVRAWQERRFARSGRLWREGALRPIADWPDAAVVCTCTGVSCGALRAARSAGSCTAVALSERTGAGTVCGSCRPLLAELAGERIGAKREAAGTRLGVAAVLGLLLFASAAWLGPIAMSDSVERGLGLGVLWRDATWKQVSGFTLLSLCGASLLLSLRKRWPRVRFGSFGGWRLLHAATGVATIVVLGLHTGFRMGANLNFALMLCFAGVVGLGAIAALVTSLEHRLAPAHGSRLRRAGTAAHVLLFGPLPVLTAWHVLIVYFY